MVGSVSRHPTVLLSAGLAVGPAPTLRSFNWPGSLNFECSGIVFDGTHLWMTNNTGQSVTEYPVT
jgi:hypothetical protein